MDNVILMKLDEQQNINRGNIERAMFSNGPKHKVDIRVQKQLYPPLLRLRAPAAGATASETRGEEMGDDSDSMALRHTHTRSYPS